jgi:Protein of unknown function (DUF2868)
MALPETTLLEDAIDVPLWLEADAASPLATRRQRDREIGRELPSGDRAKRVRLWWRRVERGAVAPVGAHLQSARRWLSLVALGVGLLGGGAIALVAFRYDGTYPVNVVRLLGLLVVPQTVMLILTLCLVPGRIPGLRFVQDALVTINPGAVIAGVYRHFAKSSPGAPKLFAWASARSTTTRRFAKWQMLHWSQIAAVAFNLAVIGTAAALIAFTDLAFGWSTTLPVGSDDVTRFVTAVARPWAALLPSAVPDAELVERSQFFRLEGGNSFDSDASRVLAGWWSFTLLTVVVYGLIPRIVLLLVAAWRVRAAARTLLLEDPHVTALLDRLDAPDVETRGIVGASDPAPRPGPLAPTGAVVHGAANGVIWSHGISADAARELARRQLGLELGVLIEAGDGPSLESERTALKAIAKGARAIIVFTPAWEPPLLEFADFLSELRSRVGASVSIVVVPVGEGAAPVTSIERDTWARAVARVGDPRIYAESTEP